MTNQEYFAFLTYYTPNYIRDVLYASLGRELNKENIQEIKKLSLEEQARRKNLPEQFVKCQYCGGYHAGKENFDNLCDKCNCFLAPYRYDVEHFGAETALEIHKHRTV
jgi:hypothetical protein